MKDKKRIKHRFLQLVSGNCTKQEVLRIMKTEFKITEDDIKQIAKELYNATNTTTNSLEGINK